MNCFKINGDVIADLSNTIDIAAIKAENPSYSDDALLDAAILAAQAKGATAKIVWDGSDIHFSGASHTCQGFGGIDFNGSTIYMPGVDRGTILNVIPDASEDLTVAASYFSKYKTTYAGLCDKVFTMNNNTVDTGNPDMCLGDRYGASSAQVVYWSPTILTTTDGAYATGELYLTPESGSVVCYNVHTYPEVTFEICNATLVTYSGNVMSLFLSCSRSNVKVHNFRLTGTNGITTFHAGIFAFTRCVDVELYDINGVNPVQEALASGYVMQFTSVSFVHVHDVYLGDVDSWGSMGSHHLCNSVFERCALDRWDCHYIQTGYHIIRDCVLNRMLYGVGTGEIQIDGCIIKNNRVKSGSPRQPIAARTDIVGVYEGNITVRNCVFEKGAQAAGDFLIWADFMQYALPVNSVINSAPSCSRIIENCKFDFASCSMLFDAGTTVPADEYMYANVSYIVRGCTLPSADAVVHTPSTSGTQAVNAVRLENCVCSSAVKIATGLSGAYYGYVVGSILNSINASGNRSGVFVTNTVYSNLITDSEQPNVVLTGNIVAA